MAFDPVTAIMNPIGTLLDRLLPDKAQNDAAKAQLAQLQLSGDLAEVAGQIQTNITEAASTNWWVSGWRPFVGWICGLALFVEYIVKPIASWIAALLGHPATFPSLDVATLFGLLAGMLGMGGLRTYEKTQGVAAK